jgi:hypothetical protein
MRKNYCRQWGLSTGWQYLVLHQQQYLLLAFAWTLNGMRSQLKIDFVVNNPDLVAFTPFP